MAKRQRHKSPLEASETVPLHVKREYWRRAADFWFSAAYLEAQRCSEKSSSAESRMLDLNFFVVACQRLRNVAIAMKREFPEAAKALAAFDRQWPQLADLRHIQEHISHPNRDPEHDLLGVAYFGDFVANLKPGGKVEYLVDTRWDVPALAEFHAALIGMIDEAHAAPNKALAADSQ